MFLFLEDLPVFKMTSVVESREPDSTEGPVPKAMPKNRARRDSGQQECFTTDHLSPIIDQILVQDYPAILPVGTSAEEAASLDIPPGLSLIHI